MKEEIAKLQEIGKKLQLYIKLKENESNINNNILFQTMIVKKTVDILTTLEYVLKNYIISVQISLMRLLCDNCLAIESALELGVDKVIELISTNQRVSSIMIDEEQNMSDGYLKRMVANKYQGFDRLYNYCCDSVHFSSQALSSSIIEEDGKRKLFYNVGNKNLKDVMISNNKNALILCSVIVDMLKKLNENP